MNIGITGASGLVGRRLTDLALRRGHEVVAFSRNPSQKIPGCSMRQYPVISISPGASDSRHGQPASRASSEPSAEPRQPALDLEGCDALVHLAGESVLGLWTPGKRARIAQSRIEGTRMAAEAFRKSRRPPRVFISASAIGFYAPSGDTELVETSPAGTGFLADTCRAWEGAAIEAGAARIVLLRTGIVLAREGGALSLMSRVFRLGLGGRLGDGTQWMSWIHVDDLARMILFCIEDESVSGPVNGTAPWPVRNAEFTAQLAKRLRRPAFFHAPAFAIKWLGEFSNELLGSKRVLPGVATAHGFPFRFPELPAALANLL